MAMPKPSASALTRGAKRLKSIATDAISIPNSEELYRRKCADLEAAKAELARTVARIVDLEKLRSHERHGHAELLVTKRRQEKRVEQLSHEGGLLKQALIDARPKPPLSPRQQLMVDSLPVPPPSPYTKKECAEAQAEVDRITLLKRQARFNGERHAEEKLMPVFKEAKLKLAVLSGGYRGDWPYMPFATREDMAAAIKKWGRK
jgi:hypothetical protein